MLSCGSAFAQAPEPVHIARTDAAITIDGDLGDPGWKNATKIEKFYEINVTDNGEPKVKTVAYLTYDAKFFYVGIESFDPDPSQIRGPYNDRDHISGNMDDFAGILLDTRDDHRSAIELFVTARNVQYDAITDDFSGEDSSPDFFWDSATKITPTGWIAEIRVPFSSLRYDNPNPREWGIMVYRNWPRDRRYQIFSNKLPHGSNCFICHETPLVGLSSLPAGGHLVTAPYAAARQISQGVDGPGSRLQSQPATGDIGVDAKWTPNANTAIDATVNPDFSQVESDAAVIQTNQRFAIFLPEKRPFFLEGIDLLKTPIQAVYTRTITSPRWGARSTGKNTANAYTILVSQDRGGGDVIIPSPVGSNFAQQPGSSTALIGRYKHNMGESFIGALATARQNQGGGYNRVAGPDFEWRLSSHDVVDGQALFSATQTPNRPDLASQWDGRKLSSYAADVSFQHSTKRFDFMTEAKDFGDDFRADNGFVPQVGFRSNYAETGWTFRPSGFFQRIRTYAMGEYDSLQTGAKLYSMMSAGFGADGKYSSFTRIRFASEMFRVNDKMLPRRVVFLTEQFSPSRIVSQLSVDGYIGQDIDYTNGRTGPGANFSYGGTFRPTNHMEVSLSNALSWLDIDRERLFTAQTERLTVRYTFNSKTFFRLILQNERTNQNVWQYAPAMVDPHDGELATQFLWAYKLNWQTVFYAGYGNLMEADTITGQLLRSNRQFFLKVSYAFQQ